MSIKHSASQRRSLALKAKKVESRKRATKKLGETISDWETEHGKLTADELATARTQLFG
ncbi:MAG: hypothetical protein OXE93_00355 [bacterium]|nr:hypothetical protein [bacterium]MCY4258318.1 hypothetical protein [bacterium]